MTEQEIIDCLKGNQKRGIAFVFMPDEVQAWCKQHRDEKIFTVYRGNTWDVDSCICCNYNGIYSLSDSYEIKPKFKPYWEEFNIEDGVFRFNDEGYHYWEVEKFLSDYTGYFNAFGGWFYEQDNTWNLAYQVQSVSSSLILYYNEHQKVFPVIPTRIRFWRYRE